MYIRMLEFETIGSRRAEAIDIIDAVVPKIMSQKGCNDCLFMMHDSDNHYALLVFWDSEQSANEAASIVGPQLLPALNRITTKPVVPRLYEVHRPQTVPVV